jgi:hypothetical protein
MSELEKKPSLLNRKFLFRERNPNLIGPGLTSIK